MRTPQERQRPRSTAYESNGTLSYQASSFPQLMQAERGWTTERRSGTRAATTFTKLPSARAGQNASTPRATSTSALSADEALRLRPGGFDGIESMPPRRAARPVAASSVAPIATAIDAPCVLPTERASRPGDERYPAKPS